LDQIKFKWVGDPQSILHNGHGSVTSCDTVSDWFACTWNSSLTELNVTRGRTYRLRIIHTGALSYFRFRVEGHNLTIVEADGVYVRLRVRVRVRVRARVRVRVKVRVRELGLGLGRTQPHHRRGGRRVR
jgi:FtsP/CotA-like multicopper oxidase with cupredoxin domain